MNQQVEPAKGTSRALELVEQVQSANVRAQIEALLPEDVPLRRFVQATTTAILATPAIVECTPDSIFAAILKSATDGLIPDGREAVLVPFKRKATYLPMIGGLRKIAAEHGWSLRTRVVYANEPFDFVFGAKPDVYHKPAASSGDRGELILAYAIARHKDGRVELDVMTKDEIEKVRKSSRSPDEGPWVDWTEGMWEKTVGRRLFKQLPLDPKDAVRVERILSRDLEELEPAKAEALVYGELPSAGVTDRQEAPDPTPAPTAHVAPEEDRPGPDPGAEPLYQGEEPEPESELLDFVVPKDKFPKRGGVTIRELVEANDRRYLRFLATEVNDDEIRAAGKAGLEALS